MGRAFFARNKVSTVHKLLLGIGGKSVPVGMRLAGMESAEQTACFACVRGAAPAAMRCPVWVYARLTFRA